MVPEQVGPWQQLFTPQAIRLACIQAQGGPDGPLQLR